MRKYNAYQLIDERTNEVVETVLTKAQGEALTRLIVYADSYHDECEEAQHSDTGVLWGIIKSFAGAAQQVLDANERSTKQ